MSANQKPNTIPVEPENATDPHALRTRRFVALANLALLPVLAALFLALVCKRELQPVYAWIADTPLANLGNRLASTFGSQAFRLADDLQLDRQADAEGLIALMEARMPTHAALSIDNTVTFGQVLSRNDQRVELAAVDGRLNETRFVPTSDLRLLKPLVHPEVELQARDASFLLRNEKLRHFCLSPVLIATEGGYEEAHDVYLTLSFLEEAFVNAFGPALNGDANRHQLLHVAITSDPDLGDHHHAATADAWYDPDNNILTIAADPAHADHQRYLRHEAAHELCRRLELFGNYASAPVWLREGIAQYCETAPFGIASARLQRLLAQGRLPWERLLAPQSLEELDENSSPNLFYAQSSFLVAWLMTERNRARFFRYLTNNRSQPEQFHDLIRLMNGVDATVAQLDQDLASFLSRPLAPSSPMPALPTP